MLHALRISCAVHAQLARGEPHLSRYTAWFLGRADGAANTGGTFDERAFNYAIQPAAQEPNNASDCFNVLP